jgi:hypothetical protein
MKKKTHDKCFEKLQSLIGCACIGDKLSEFKNPNVSIIRNIVSILYLNHMIDKNLHDEYVDRLEGCYKDPSVIAKAKTATSKRQLTLREKLENEFGEWLCRQGLSVPDEKCDLFIDKCMEIIKEK